MHHLAGDVDATLVLSQALLGTEYTKYKCEEADGREMGAAVGW